MNLSDKIIEKLYVHVANITDIYKLISLSGRFFKVYRQTNVIVFLNKISLKKDKFKAFIHFYRYLPKQGSEEWLKIKRGNIKKPPTIGGSEMEKLIRNSRELAEAKLDPKPFTGNIHTRWGNLFEEVLSFIFDLIFKTSSIETGSTPGLRDQEGNIIQAYSPDRLMFLAKERLREIIFADFNSA